ncbi:MAG: hypothetical protein CMD02_04555 [Flavobacteriales bacterium]|nr:hypothetical protein [Flavobacteriales bacterium]|tara:strand:+ start:502 stop:1599 length:1098 start_codon:yes stop_codon:yes gene_type:complete
MYIKINLFSNIFSCKKKIVFKIKKLVLLNVFILISLNVFTQNSALISNCNEFVVGNAANWPHVLVATTIDSGAISQGSQTFNMNVTNLPAGGANFRVYKTVANGNDFFGNPIPLTLGSNTFTVSSVNFDRAVKFQFSSGDVEFDALTLNGVNSDCVIFSPPSSSSLINNCLDFVSGPNSWPYVLVATTIDSGLTSHGSQTFTMNVASLPVGGANVRVYKTVANGNDFFGNPIPLVLGSNSLTVTSVNFDRAVKFQFSSGDVEFDELSLNGVNSDCIYNITSNQLYQNFINLNIFPNPTNGDLFIESNDIIKSLEIKDLSGKLLIEMHPQLSKVHIQTSQFENSFYLLSCLIKQEWITRKILLNQR